MRKSIFLSVLALAAVVSCQKSEIVDSKFNETIGFESYLGRDAQTKGAIIEKNDLSAVKVYGYYTGNGTWSDGTNGTAATTPNLWTEGLTLNVSNGVAVQPSGNDVRYWANATDKYTFLAYAPIDNVNLIAPAGTNPTLTYTVTSDFQKHVDVLRAEPIINQSKNDLSGNVSLVFKHTLARVTVKAKVDKATPFDFHIKSIQLSGDFPTKGTLPLAGGEWTITETTEDAVFDFYQNAAKANEAGAVALTTAGIDYATVVPEGAPANSNYMMMLPTTSSATLKVVYTTYSAGLESREYEKTFEITSGFAAGNAYAFILNFYQEEGNEISFSVDVTPWDESEPSYDVNDKPVQE